ncbi:hypothetical protein [Gemmata sp.]|uniref:hypothetical protein n=1 Tax=Gemmata sp. TaxID=1914242 RepID=UPI003F6E8A20
MVSMAKKKPQAEGTGKRARTGAPVQAFIDPDIRAAVDAYIEAYNAENEHKATLTSTLEAALKMYLTNKGHWPKR